MQRQRQRDTQRKKLYDAEHALWLASERIEYLPDIEMFVVAALIKVPSPAARSVQNSILTGRFKFGDGRGARGGKANRDSIHLPKFARHKLYILHELAHVLVERDPSIPWHVASHGPEFAGVYLDIVNRVMGFDWWVQLRASFQRGKVRFREVAEAAKAA